MLVLAKLISILILGFGLTVLFLPQVMKRVLSFWQEGKRIYFAGAARALIGLLLLGVASESVLPQAVVALGLLFLVAAALVFITGADRLKIMIAWWLEVPPMSCRLIGLVLAAFGALMLSIL